MASCDAAKHLMVDQRKSTYYLDNEPCRRGMPRHVAALQNYGDSEMLWFFWKTLAGVHALACQPGPKADKTSC